MDPIPKQPTLEETENAVEDLKGLLSGLCFADEVSLSVAISMLVTGVTRVRMDVVPMHAIASALRGRVSHISSMSQR